MEPLATRILFTVIISTVGAIALACLILVVRRIQLAFGMKDEHQAPPPKVFRS